MWKLSIQKFYYLGFSIFKYIFQYAKNQINKKSAKPTNQRKIKNKNTSK